MKKNFYFSCCNISKCWTGHFKLKEVTHEEAKLKWRFFLKTIRRIFFHQSNNLTNHYLCACVCRWKITATLHGEKSILRIKISSKPKKKKKKNSRESDSWKFYNSANGLKIGKKERVHVDTEPFSRILPSSVPIPPFESKAFTNYSPEFHSHPNTKIQNFNSHSPEFHPQKNEYSRPENYSTSTFHQFFRSSIVTRFILSYLILS